ncbi:hypothetical protein [Neomoorella humiferrea]|uniref:CobQ/CobB/MinD/ParA nucleotide binding domain protein n=1 Tax=Neomoorella humiferrea TaxID=676965 RepID=A0A2T0ATI9_9FIRM|nr:hypothetical protein [Moorella humiferrea]PRR73700.1 hypothetical protein MOHU_11130 [Moorella humiferrea]
MILALILTPARAEQVRKAVKEHGEVVYDQAGTMDSFGIRNALQSAARVAADALILDIDAGPGPDLVAAVQGYRIARPYTRIFLLAPGRQPGDATVARLVGLGVYDIIDGPVEADWGDLVAQSLTNTPATYAQAARWHIMTGLTEEEQVKEKVVIEQRPVGVVTIAVAGAAPGLGCTHTALAISAFLARQGHNVALVEDSQEPVMQDYLKIIKAGPGRVSKAWRIKGFDVFPFAKTEVDKFIEGDGNFIFDELLAELSAGRYEYIVRDLGVADKKRAREAFRSNLAVLVASAARWRWGDLLKIEPLSSFRLALVAPAERDVKEIRRIPELKAYVMPYHPDPFCMPDEILTELLRPVLPQAREKKKPFWVRWRVVAVTSKRPSA